MNDPPRRRPMSTMQVQTTRAPATTSADTHNLVLTPHLAGIRLSPEEFDAVEQCDKSWRYELILGVLVVSPHPLEAERDSNGEVGYLLRNYREEHPRGSI